MSNNIIGYTNPYKRDGDCIYPYEFGNYGISNPIKYEIMDFLREVSLSGIVEEKTKARAITLLEKLKNE